MMTSCEGWRVLFESLWSLEWRRFEDIQGDEETVLEALYPMIAVFVFRKTVASGIFQREQLLNDEQCNSSVLFRFVLLLPIWMAGKRNRFVDATFNLDLTYISDRYDVALCCHPCRIIAMGYPSTKFESLFRNNITDVGKGDVKES